MKTGRFCNVCRWGHDIGSYIQPLWGCSNQLTGSSIDPVDGRRLYMSCSAVRRPDRPCGPEGALWEARDAS